MNTPPVSCGNCIWRHDNPSQYLDFVASPISRRMELAHAGLSPEDRTAQAAVAQGQALLRLLALNILHPTRDHVNNETTFQACCLARHGGSHAPDLWQHIRLEQEPQLPANLERELRRTPLRVIHNSAA